MLKNTKRKLFTVTTKSICCSILATGLLLQTSNTTFAASSGQNIINTGVLASNTSESELNTLLTKISNLKAPTQAENPDIIINEQELKLNVGESFELQLIHKDGTKVNNVEWFVRIRIPYDTLYTAESFNQREGICATINDGLVTAKTKGDTEIWAKVDDSLYKCTVTVKYEKDSELEKKVDEIANKFRHLTHDADKVMAVHDYILDNVEYSYEHIVSYAYGALIEGKAVCQGYAQSFQKILSKLNIEGHTVKGWSNAEDGEYHEWNRIKLDDGWYFIDNTWDDVTDSPYKSYKHFLINSEMLGKNHRDWASYSDEHDGSKYIYYAYKKQGVLAENKEQLKNILKAQINSSNSSNITIRAAIPKTMPQNDIITIVKEITGGNPYFNEITQIRDTFGNYQFYAYEVSGIPAKTLTDVTLNDISSGNADNETTSKLIFTFNQDIEDFSINDISIKDVHKTVLTKTGTGTYELSFTDMMFTQSTTLPVSVHKRGFNIANNERNVHINVVKEPTPNVTFKAVGRREGRLEGVESGMAYNLGDGIWQDINSGEPLTVTTKFSYPVLIKRKSINPGIWDSDIQSILPFETREPVDIKAVDSTENDSNGKIIYVNRKMEYQKDGEQAWTACTGNEVTGLAAGKYNVRYKADGLKLASEGISVTVNTAPTVNNTDNILSGKPGISGGGSSGGNVGSGGGFTGGGGFGGGGFAGGGASFGGGFTGGGGSASSINDKADTTLNNEKTTNTKTNETQVEKTENTSVKSEIAENIKPTISKNVANFSKPALDSIIKSGVKTLDFTSNKIKLSFETKTLKSLNKQVDSDIQIQAVKTNNTKLSDKAKKLMGKHTVYNLNISDKNGTKITKLEKGKVTISIPYKLGKKEKAENVTVYFINKKGNVKKISNYVYDAKTKTLTFSTKSLLHFAVGYKNK